MSLVLADENSTQYNTIIKIILENFCGDSNQISSCDHLLSVALLRFQGGFKLQGVHRSSRGGLCYNHQERTRSTQKVGRKCLLWGNVFQDIWWKCSRLFIGMLLQSTNQYSEYWKFCGNGDFAVTGAMVTVFVYILLSDEDGEENLQFPGSWIQRSAGMDWQDTELYSVSFACLYGVNWAVLDNGLLRYTLNLWTKSLLSHLSWQKARFAA